MSEKQTVEPGVSFKDTLNLPQTDFPIRPNAKEDDPAMIARWQKEQLYDKAFNLNKGKEKFILHDGPPYANGHIHLGHAYNKILKDITTKSQRMAGKNVPVTPGWDCHGLPIEHKVTQELKNADRVTLLKACREYAQKWIEVQLKEFERLGVVMDWNHPYSTMDFSYEAAILEAFSDFVADGYIERKNKTVPWCPSCQTVLASAEIEYQDRKDPSIYVLFPVVHSTLSKRFPVLEGKEVSVVVWTTTPWTLPLNRAVLLKPGATYSVVEIDGKYVMVAKPLVEKLGALVNMQPTIVAELSAQEFVDTGAKAQHPFIDSLQTPFILDNSVLLEDGTAFVHSAPGVGPEDYEVGVRNKLEIYSPITSDGKYTAAILPAELAGMPVADGQIWVIKKLAEKGRLFFKTSIRHSYPHCWRCHNGLIFRATKQWFCDLTRNDLKTRALAATETIRTIPEKSINRLQATLEGRLEWCLSRQRVWGVPIPALLCEHCDYAYTTPEFIRTVAQGVAKEGIAYWDTVSVEQLQPKNVVCPHCKKADFKKEYDILDVWFESGVSHYAVLSKNPALRFPADMYLEGSDQHRAWFQSSLLTGVVLDDKAPMKEIMTHGFVVDEKGHKMSKSLGNVVSPQELIDQMGTDGLRLWVSSLDLSGDAVVSQVLLRNVAEVYRKIRNTSRFLLSNLYDFSIEKDAIAVNKLRAIDQYALYELSRLDSNVLQAYAAYDYTAVFHLLSNYCSVNLSAFYLDIVKDRLYVEAASGYERRSAQTACWYILDTLTKLTAPILSFTAEAVSDHYQVDKKESIHLQPFADLSPVVNQLLALYGERKPSEMARYTGAFFEQEQVQNRQQAIQLLGDFENAWEQVLQVRSALLKAIEIQRELGLIKHSLEARLVVYVDPQSPVYDGMQILQEQLALTKETVEQFLKEFLIVSQVELGKSSVDLAPSVVEGLFVNVSHAKGEKCPRCWQWSETPHHYNLCGRCAAIVKK